MKSSRASARPYIYSVRKSFFTRQHSLRHRARNVPFLATSKSAISLKLFNCIARINSFLSLAHTRITPNHPMVKPCSRIDRSKQVLSNIFVSPRCVRRNSWKKFWGSHITFKDWLWLINEPFQTKCCCDQDCLNNNLRYNNFIHGRNIPFLINKIKSVALTITDRIFYIN